MFKLNTILFVAIVGCISVVLGASQKDWRYIMHMFEWNCTNENIIAAQLRPVRIAPGVYGLNGTISIGGLIDKEYKVSMKILRSPSGSGNYQITPFGLPKTSFTVFMNTAYKQLAMKDLQNCSNLPIFERYTDPLAVGVYRLNSCIVSTDFMPTHMKEGYYKIVYEAEGPSAHFVSELISEVRKI